MPSKTPAKSNENVHSSMFSGNDLESIPDRLAKTTGDITITSSSDQEGLTMRDPTASSYPPQRLVDLACYADAVVLATPVKGISHMTADQNFVYSEWTMRIQEVLQDTSKAPIGERQTILVVRSGGVLHVNGRTIQGNAFNFPTFNLNATYLLFLTYIPETGAFKAKTGRSFDLSLSPHSVEGNVSAFDASQYQRAESISPDELIKNTRAAIASAAVNTSCKKRGDE